MSFRAVVKKAVPKRAFRAIEPQGHRVEAIGFAAINGFPARNLKVIGVTGTDGKTTTCMLIAQMLRHNGHKVALLTTVSVDLADGKGERPAPSHLTTASAGSLFAMLKTVAQNQPDWVVLETSSHALAQHRVWGVPYSVAVMTNVSHEHLDYHRTLNRYVAAKTRLFRLCGRNKDGLQTGVINADDPHAAAFAKCVPNTVMYGLERGDIRAKNVVSTVDGNSFTVQAPDGTYRIKTKLAGAFNVYNVLAAIGVGRTLGLTASQIEKGIASLEAVPGRMMPVKLDKPYQVYVDYAVTPKALESVLTTARAMAQGKVSIVFGATGDRDKAKRPVMGEIVARLADSVYLTDDETHTEDPPAIRAAVRRGVVKAGGESKLQEFADRGEAIAAALKAAKKGDIILLTGLGHQTTRNMGGKDEPWSDVEAVLEKQKKL